MLKNQPILLILIGPPGSGKTYFGEKLSAISNYIHVNSDGVRSKYFSNPSFTTEERVRVYNKIKVVVTQLLNTGHNVIFDGNLLTNNDRRQALDYYTNEVGAKVLFVAFDVPQDLAIQRALSRKTSNDNLYNAMPEERAVRMHATFEPLDPALPSLVICDSVDYDKVEALIKNQLAVHS